MPLSGCATGTEVVQPIIASACRIDLPAAPIASKWRAGATPSTR